MSGRVPGVLGHQHVALQRVVEGRIGLLLHLGVEDAVDAAVVALLAVEVAVHRLREQRVDDLVLLLLRDQDVDVELGPKARDLLDQLQRRHLQHARVAAVVLQGVEGVVDDHGLDVAVLLDRLERVARGGDAGEHDAERVVQALGGRVQALDELLEDQRLVVDDQDAADRFAHAKASVHRTHSGDASGGERENSGKIARHANAPLHVRRAARDRHHRHHRVGRHLPSQRLGRTPVRRAVPVRRRPAHQLLALRATRDVGRGASGGVDARLERINPAAFEFLLGFARDNELRLRHTGEQPGPDMPATRMAANRTPWTTRGRVPIPRPAKSMRRCPRSRLQVVDCPRRSGLRAGP